MSSTSFKIFKEVKITGGRIVESSLKSAMTDVRKALPDVFDNTSKSLTIYTRKTGQSCYDRNHLVMALCARTAGRDFAHEYAHHVDNLLVKASCGMEDRDCLLDLLTEKLIYTDRVKELWPPKSSSHKQYDYDSELVAEAFQEYVTRFSGKKSDTVFHDAEEEFFRKVSNILIRYFSNAQDKKVEEICGCSCGS